MTKKARQAYQYEAPVTPSKWTGEEQRFSIRVKAILEDLYQKFSRLVSSPAIDSAKLGGKDASLYALKTDIPDGYKLEEKVLWSGEANTGTTLNFSENIRSYDFVTMKIGWQTSMPMVIANSTTFLNFNVIEHNVTNGRIQVHVGRLSSIASDGLSAIIEYAATNFMYITNTSANTSSAAVVRTVTGYRLAAK